MNSHLNFLKSDEIKSQKNIVLYSLCGLATIIIFIVDLAIPLGVAGGVPYIVPVLLTLWLPTRKSTLVMAICGSILTIVGFFFSPPGGEMWKVLFNRGLALFAIWTTATLSLHKKTSEKMREKAFSDLEKALSEIKILKGFLPICASCKKIRDDKGYWNQIETYITAHADVNFSHGICPDCAKKLYPEFYNAK